MQGRERAIVTLSVRRPQTYNTRQTEEKTVQGKQGASS